MLSPSALDRTRVRATSWAAAAAIAAALSFVLAVDAQPMTSGLGDVALVALALIVAAMVASYLAAGERSRLGGSVVALLALWLLPQRADIGSALVLAVLFGAATGLIVGSFHTTGMTAGLTALPVALVVAGRVIGSQHVIVAISAILIIVVAVLRDAPVEADPTTPPSRARVRVTTTVLIAAATVFAMYVGAETPSAHWFGGGITRGPTANREVALTFDDGPNLTATLPLVRILDAAHTKATFFEVGHAIDKTPWITQTLYRDGQGLGNHSYHHDAWRWLDPRYPELQRTQAVFQRVIGVCPAFYRPPHGDRTPFVAHVVNDHRMRLVMWDDSAGDWAVKSPRTIARRILRDVRPGSIIVLHDGLNGNPLANRTVLVRALPLILDGLRAKRLHPVRLDQLIGGPAFVPCQ